MFIVTVFFVVFVVGMCIYGTRLVYREMNH
jgi:hypothetical protein